MKIFTNTIVLLIITCLFKYNLILYVVRILGVRKVRFFLISVLTEIKVGISFRDVKGFLTILYLIQETGVTLNWSVDVVCRRSFWDKRFILYLQ